MAMTAESSLASSILVADIFVRVIVGFGEDWAAIGRLPAMVGDTGEIGVNARLNATKSPTSWWPLPERKIDANLSMPVTGVALLDFGSGLVEVRLILGERKYLRAGGKGLKLKDDNDMSEECKSAKRALFKVNRQKQPFDWGHHDNMPRTI
eukprot:scaffold23990_cov47-Cyclotella_meneghiniana.AAC.2